jgi:hypothetical protein
MLHPNLLSLQTGMGFGFGIDFDGTIRELFWGIGWPPGAPPIPDHLRWRETAIPTARSAAMITGRERTFALNDNRTLYYLGSDPVTDQPKWVRIRSVASEDYLAQISSGKGSVLYALQTAPGTVRRLYRAKFTELS